MTKVISAVFGGLLLSGCALPVPIQIASWALDGLSLLTTEKSITDHGISMVAQQDCALWRGVSEGSVCREDDPMAIIAEQGDVYDDGDHAADSGASLTAFVRSVSTSSSHNEPQSPAIQTSWVLTPESIPDVAVAETTPIEEEPVSQAPQLQVVSQEAAYVAPPVDEMTSYSAAPGDYFVIGSFGVWDNAERFASRYPVLEPQILSASVADTMVYRIVVGPYNVSSRMLMRLTIKGMGIEGTWALRVPADEITLAWRSSGSVIELASVPTSE